MVFSVDYNVIHGTIVSLEHSHTSDLHIAGFTDSWNVKSVKDSKNYFTLFSHFSSVETKAQDRLRVEPRVDLKLS